MNDLGRMVAEWLEREDYGPEPGEAEGAHWVLAARMPNGWAHHVAHLAGKEEVLIIQSAFMVTDEERAFLATLSPGTRVALAWEIRMTLLFKDTEFDIQDSIGGFPAGFTFRRELSYDGLTRNVFMEALREVHKCCLYVSWCVQREFQLRNIPAEFEAP